MYLPSFKWVVPFIVAPIGLAVILLSITSYLDVGENHCEMTWMYEYPEYIKIPMKEEIKMAFPRYNLYVYGEGWYGNSLKNLEFHGLPVLFIPGNAGSYKQVRSLGSVALRKSENNRHHFNIFATDLNDELSALDQQLIIDQADFVNIAVKTILELYPEKSRLVLVGHSLGGLISRLLFLNDDFNPHWVSAMITLATPHRSSVLPFDVGTSTVYNYVNAHWYKFSSGSKLSTVSIVDLLKTMFTDDGYNSGITSGILQVWLNQTNKLTYVPPMVSVGGGKRDILVRSDLTTLDGLVPDSRHISIISTAVPRVWASADHRCIVWCNQLVLATARALFDLIDVQSGQFTDNEGLIIEVLKHHFEKPRHGQKSYHMKPCAATRGKLQIKNKKYFVIASREDTVHVNKKKNVIVSIREGFLLVKSNIDLCAYICTMNSNSSCKYKGDMKDFTFIYPVDGGFVQFIKFNLSLLQKNEIIVMSGKETLEQNLFIADINESISQSLVYPYWLPRSSTFTYEQKTLYLLIALPFVKNRWDVYDISVEVDKTDNNISITARFSIPWSNEDVFSTGNGKVHIETKFYKRKSLNTPDDNSACLEVWTQESAQVIVTIRRSVIKTLREVFLMLAPMKLLKSITVITFIFFVEDYQSRAADHWYDGIKYTMPTICIASQFVVPYLLSVPSDSILIVLTLLLSFSLTFLLYILVVGIFTIVKKLGVLARTGDAVTTCVSRTSFLFESSVPLLVLILSCASSGLISSLIIVLLTVYRQPLQYSRQLIPMSVLLIIYLSCSLPGGAVWFKMLQTTFHIHLGLSSLGAGALSLAVSLIIHFECKYTGNLRYIVICICFVFLSTNVIDMSGFAVFILVVTVLGQVIKHRATVEGSVFSQ